MNFCFTNNRSANSVAGISMRQRMILLLLGEKAGMREDVNKVGIDAAVDVSLLIHIRRKLEPTHVRCYKFIHFVKKGIPGLMNIPWIGGAFSRTSDTLTNTEIVILITPRIAKAALFPYCPDYTLVPVIIQNKIQNASAK